MYEYMINNPIVAIIFVIIVIMLILLVVIKTMQSIGLEKIRSKVYDGFVKAENEFQHGDNTEKFEYVIRLARDALPSPFNLFITESLLRKVIQLWFDICKNLLDDGKLN